MFPLATTSYAKQVSQLVSKAYFHWQPHLKQSKFYHWWGKHVSTGDHILYKVSFTIGEESMFPLATTSYTKLVSQLVRKAYFQWQPHLIQIKFHNWWGNHVSTGNHILYRFSFTIGEESMFPLATTSYTKQVSQLVRKACFHWQPHILQSKFHNWWGKHVSTGNHILYKVSFTIQSKFHNWWGKHVSIGNHILCKASFTIGE